MQRSRLVVLGLVLIGVAAVAMPLVFSIGAVAPPRPDARTDRIDLTDLADVAALERETASIEFGSDAGRAHYDEPDPREHARAGGLLTLPYADASARCAVAVGDRVEVRFTVFRERAGEALLEATGLPAGPETQRVEVFLNDDTTRIAGFALPQAPALTTLPIPIDANRLVRGTNRLVFRFARTERREFQSAGPFRLPMAAIFKSLRFRWEGDAEAATGRPAPHDLGRELLGLADGSIARALVFEEGTRLELPLRLPEGRPVLRARMMVHPDDRAPIEPIAVVVRLQAEPGGGLLIARPALFAADATRAPVDIEVDLSLFCGQVVSLQFETSTPPRDRRALRIVLADPVVTGGHPAPDPSVPGNGPSADSVRAGLVRANVVLFTLDAAGARNLTAYGADREYAPTVDTLARDGATFEGTTSTASYTLPSIASLFTGLWPSRHGVVETDRSLAPDTPTLAGALRRAGYSTLALVTNPNAGAAYGLDQGFDVYDELNKDPALWHAGVPADALATRLDLHLAQGRLAPPYFLYVHVFQPHAPYQPPPRFSAGLADPRYSGPADGGRDGIDAYRSQANDAWTRADFAELKARYLANLRWADSAVAAVLARLEAAGLLEHTMIGVVGDHGEAFGEHGTLEHGDTTFAEEIEVPFILRLPPAAPLPPTRVLGPNTLADLTPTLLGLLGVDAGGARFDGLDRTDGLLGAAAPDRSLFARSSGVEPRLVVRRLDASLHVDTHTRALRLYDLARDPLENTPIQAHHRAMTEWLRAELDRHARANLPASARRAADPDLAAQAAQIGYLRGAAPATGAGAGSVLHRRTLPPLDERP